MRAAIFFAFITSVSPASWPAQTPSERTSDQAPAGNAERGKRLYVARACWMCHQYAAQGGDGPGGPRLAGRLPKWDAFAKYVRRPTDQMSPYTAKVLPDDELADIYAWLRTLPPPPTVTSLPQLKD